MDTNTNIAEIGLTEIEGEPRARDTDLAERLGFGRPRDIRKLIERNMPEIEAFGTCATVARVVRGNPSTEYWLNEEQSLLVAVVSDAPNAPAVRAMLIKTFVAWRRGHLPAIDQQSLARQIAAIVDDKLARHGNALVTRMLPDAVAGHFNEHNLSIADGLTSGEVCHLSGVSEKYPRGISTKVSGHMVRFCSVRNITVPVTRLGRVRAMVFPTHAAREWLDLEGRGLIKRWVEEKTGQQALRLSAPKHEPEVATRLREFIDKRAA